VAARRVIRQFRGLPERMIARIADNADPAWADTDRGTADMPPTAPTLRDWSENLPLGSSPTWIPPYGVRYAVEFEYGDGTLVRSAWWRAVRQDGEGYGSHDYALPLMGIPCDPSGQIVARRIVRQFRGLPERMIARIANNTDATWTDSDRGTADMPPPPTTIHRWSALLPLASSPVWQPRVRRALRGGLRVRRRDGGAQRLVESRGTGAGRRWLRVEPGARLAGRESAERSDRPDRGQADHSAVPRAPRADDRPDRRQHGIRHGAIRIGAPPTCRRRRLRSIGGP
jgi:hypothetical protein